MPLSEDFSLTAYPRKAQSGKGRRHKVKDNNLLLCTFVSLCLKLSALADSSLFIYYYTIKPSFFRKILLVHRAAALLVAALAALRMFDIF